MTADLKVMLEQAVDRCLELAERAQHAATNGFPWFEDAVDEWHGDLEGTIEKLHGHAERTVRAMDEDREAVRTHAEGAQQDLRDLARRADEGTTAAQRLLATVQEDMEHLASVRDAARKEAEESTRHIVDGLDTLLQDVATFRAGIESRFDPLPAAFASLRDALTEARGNVEGEVERMEEAIQELGPFSLAQASQTGSAVAALMEVVEGQAAELCEAVGTIHEEAAEALHSALTDEDGASPSETWMTQALEPVREAVAELALLPEPAAEFVAASVQASLDEGDKAIDALGDTAESLRRASGALAP